MLTTGFELDRNLFLLLDMSALTEQLSNSEVQDDGRVGILSVLFGDIGQVAQGQYYKHLHDFTSSCTRLPFLICNYFKQFFNLICLHY